MNQIHKKWNPQYSFSIEEFLISHSRLSSCQQKVRGKSSDRISANFYTFSGWRISTQSFRGFFSQSVPETSKAIDRKLNIW